MNAFLAEIASLVDRPPPREAEALWRQCALVPWETRTTQGVVPLRDAIHRHIMMVDQGIVEPTNEHLCADIAASYAIDAAHRGLFYAARPIPEAGCSSVVRAIVAAIHAERQPVKTLPMKLQAGGKVSIEFPPPQ